MIVLRSSLASALLVYGGIAAAVAVLFLPLARERPAG
jgi:hypothetical protein